MLNEFAGIRKVSDESLGRDETPRDTSHEILDSSQVFDNFFLEEYVVFIQSNWSFYQGTTSAPFTTASPNVERKGTAEYFFFFNKCNFLWRWTSIKDFIFIGFPFVAFLLHLYLKSVAQECV